MDIPNFRVMRIQGRLRVMDAVGRRIVRDELHELLRIEEGIRKLMIERKEQDEKIIAEKIMSDANRNE